MDRNSPKVSSGSLQNSNDENPRFKFLCSFGGSILPRPHDGKLRYVGGETRIVSVTRDISFEELMAKMKELFEGATVCKYQQPDEDLDALVSVVNDDDVINMMEEYDKLGPGDGLTKLRIFLFTHLDHDGSLQFSDGGDGRENERRYVDALNSFNDSPEYKNHGEFWLDDVHITEQCFHHMNLEGTLHNQRNTEMQVPQINLHHLNIPHLGLGQHLRYNDIDAQLSPVFYSPRQPGQEPRPMTDVASSPSSSRHYLQYAEAREKGHDRNPEDYSRLQVNHQPFHEQLPQFAENMLFFPNGPVPAEKASFQGCILNSPQALEGNIFCENCQMTFQRNQPYPDSPWKRGNSQYAEANTGSGLQLGSRPFAESPPNWEIPLNSTDANMHRRCSHALSNDYHNNDRGWVVRHHSNPQPEEPRTHIPGVGRLTDHNIIDNGINISVGHNVPETRWVPPYYVHHDNLHNIRAGHELGNQVFLDQAVDKGSQIPVPPVDESGVRYRIPHTHETDPLYQLSHGHIVANSMWRNVHGPMHGNPSNEACGPTQQANGTSGPTFVGGLVESYPNMETGFENANHSVDLSLKEMAFDESSLSGCIKEQKLRSTPTAFTHEIQSAYTPEPAVSSSEMFNPVAPIDLLAKGDHVLVVHHEVVSSSMPGASTKCSDLEFGDKASNVIPIEFTRAVHTIKGNGSSLEKDKQHDDSPGFLPDMIASVLKSVKDIEAKVPEDALSFIEDVETTDVGILNESDAVGRDAHGGSGIDSDNDNLDNAKIEPTEAEKEAIERGLQTIRNEDLEEIRELGSGTYGAVYHGKWKGSDVAIKRIKASCFAGRPSERERLIADFWKEALILSTLHHPNVVSFYGVVRDGPDGSLATLTEFMVNGSLKQFLRKKDRTIDRRKRLIIAMDTAFGMEYLHGKNIVHFDLKCENLLVNMRDPHRPVCKIGDLGLSKVKQQTLVSGGVRGTLPWMAPELLSGKSNMVTEKIDVYSFGIVMWELLTGDEPYADMHCTSIIGGIVNNSLRPQVPTWCDPEWKSLMESCWASDPSERPSFSEVSQKLRSMAAAMNVK
ncbi:unnamed protein product [Cuscuta campestris]|uniref:Protein kinase domain-containing protein n=1 Tax=Cuscuta campestris TaxID=132261 RepID=A0A484LY00_9ASTE|nr:unnamed protein product [Cuscuta campestris]